MAKRRMTTRLRELATDALLRHATEAKVTAHCQAERDLVNEVAAAEIGQDRKLYEAILKACQEPGRNWLNITTSISVNAGGWNLSLNFFTRGEKGQYTPHNSRFHIYLLAPKDTVPLPVFICHGRINIQDEALIARIQAHSQAEKALHEEAAAIFGKIRSTVASYSTVEALLADIPELATLEPALVTPAPVQAVVAPAKSLMCDIAAFRGEEREGCPCEAAPEPELIAA